MSQKLSPGGQKKLHVWLYASFVLVTSFFTYMYRFDFPPNPFWDEPYHIASAQKYLSGVYFMEQHPPLGKLFIAFGEKVVHGNEKNDQFINTDYAANIPQGFNFAGYRLFPSLFAWLTASVLFFIFLFITGSNPLSALLSFLYVFDNAQIVHSRGAMVDSTLTFFGMLCVLLFLHLQRRDKSSNLNAHCMLSIFLGVCFALAVTTKVVALIFILLFPLIASRLYPNWKKISLFCILSSVSFFITYCSVWQIHFSNGTRIVTELADSGYYQASEQYKSILATHGQNSLSSFPVMLRDHLKFVKHYNVGVPRLDLCKKDENGSPSYFWPFGARSINYRWEQSNENEYRYLYLQSNPVAWGLGLLGVIFTVILLVGACLFNALEKLRHPFLLLTFLGFYCSYMLAISRITRVMYLYHYFLPLLFSFILFALVVANIQRIGRFVVNDDRRIVSMTVLGLLIFGAFQFYRPLSYYEPITDKAFSRRAILQLWELTCVRCQKLSWFVVPAPK
ncbi:phospholipid carrier-dependent glycosyltransferase [Candidatus Peribacteria bacterium]|nr:phospholipid carrier-dependent glycosyltransferase [Candidatus Peribacteria bacterium]